MRMICGSILIIVLGVALSFGAEIDGAKFKLAEKLYNQKNYPSALTELKDVIQNYPYSPYYSKALYYTARSYFETKDFLPAARYFALAEKKSQKDSDKRLSLFGLGESLYQLKKWNDSAVTFMNFAIRYKDSPAAPAALYYSAQSLEAMNLQAEARSVYQTLLSQYPASTYAPIALKKLGMIESSSKKTNAIDISDNALNVIDLKQDIRNMTNTIILTNTLFQTNQPFPQYVQPVNQNPPLDVTNYIEISNQTIVTQQVLMLDTNEIELQKEYRENVKKEEEIDRFRSLIELKAKLLEIKEKALDEKKNEIIENPSEGQDNE
jgi:tetratricopeptide (TPR) repeat protein